MAEAKARRPAPRCWRRRGIWKGGWTGLEARRPILLGRMGQYRAFFGNLSVLLLFLTVCEGGGASGPSE